MMAETGILFREEMVSAILAGRKTQTRRPAQRAVDGWRGFDGDTQWVTVKAGDRLWVRESAYIFGRWRQNGYTAGGRMRWRFVEHPSKQVLYVDDPHLSRHKIRTGAHDRTMTGDAFWLRPSIFMPRWASRLDLVVQRVRRQHLFEITEADAQAEGAPAEPSGDVPPSHIAGFMALWRRIHGPDSWERMMQVIALDFTPQRKDRAA